MPQPNTQFALPAPPLCAPRRHPTYPSQLSPSLVLPPPLQSECDMTDPRSEPRSPLLARNSFQPKCSACRLADRGCPLAPCTASALSGDVSVAAISGGPSPYPQSYPSSRYTPPRTRTRNLNFPVLPTLPTLDRTVPEMHALPPQALPLVPTTSFSTPWHHAPPSPPPSRQPHLPVSTASVSATLHSSGKRAHEFGMSERCRGHFGHVCLKTSEAWGQASRQAAFRPP